MLKLQSIALAFLCLGVLSACSPKVETRGYVNDKAIQDQLVVGTSTRDEVQSLLGSPSSRSSFGSETWYYISGRKEAVAFMKAEVVEQKVVRIEFNEAGIVQKVEGFSEKDSQDFALVGRTTPTEGHTLGFVEQALGNIGRFNRGVDGSQSVAPGRRQSPSSPY
jgi:outer membrane protein assembly factor BamE (lipoprotein component of BamABCDE complex)